MTMAGLLGSAVRLVLASVFFVGISTAAAQGSVQCKWDEYYDDQMDNCGPCREICDHMKLTRTEEECQKQCSDYLTSKTCTYQQYYDENVRNCAPCTELCDRHQLKRTTGDCFSRCHSYMTAKNCTSDQYYNEKDRKCSSCAQLCSQHDETGTTDSECFQKCRKYVEKNPPNNILSPGETSNTAKTGQSKGQGDLKATESPSTHPGIIVTIVIGLVAIAGAITGVALYCYHSRQTGPNYAPAPSRDAERNAAYDEKAKGSDPVYLSMVELGPGVPDSSAAALAPPPETASAAALGSTASGQRGANTSDSPQGNPGEGSSEYARPECDPLGPSSAASRLVGQIRAEP